MNEKLTSYLMEIWDRASLAEVGLSIEEVNDRQLFERKMYEARREQGGYEDIALVMPDIEGVVWLVKKGIGTNTLPYFESESNGNFGSILRKGDIDL